MSALDKADHARICQEFDVEYTKLYGEQGGGVGGHWETIPPGTLEQHKTDPTIWLSKEQELPRHFLSFSTFANKRQDIPK